MNLRSFLKAGHTPSLFCAFLYFDISFMVWVLLGALANSIVPEFQMSETQRGMMLAFPLLGGSILRLVGDHPRRQPPLALRCRPVGWRDDGVWTHQHLCEESDAEVTCGDRRQLTDRPAAAATYIEDRAVVLYRDVL